MPFPTEAEYQRELDSDVKSTINDCLAIDDIDAFVNRRYFTYVRDAVENGLGEIASSTTGIYHWQTATLMHSSNTSAIDDTGCGMPSIARNAIQQIAFWAYRQDLMQNLECLSGNEIGEILGASQCMDCDEWMANSAINNEDRCSSCQEDADENDEEGEPAEATL